MARERERRVRAGTGRADRGGKGGGEGVEGVEGGGRARVERRAAVTGGSRNDGAPDTSGAFAAGAAALGALAAAVAATVDAAAAQAVACREFQSVMALCGQNWSCSSTYFLRCDVDL